MLRAVSLASLLTTLVAQAPKVEDLLADDWQVRNAAARALAAAPAEELDVDALLRVLQSAWSGRVPGPPGMYGGRGGPRATREPRRRIPQAARELLVSRGAWGQSLGDRVVDASELVVPWHPHALAAWLIEHHTVLHGTRSDQPIDGNTEELARAWLLLAAPDEATVPRELAQPVSGQLLAAALLQLGRRPALEDALASGDATARRHVLALRHADLLARDDCLLAAVEQFLNDDEPGAMQGIAPLLRQHAERTAATLGKVLADARADDPALARGLVLLCTIDDPSPAAALALAHIADADAEQRERALFLLGQATVPAELRARAAPELFSLSQDSRDRDTRLLAFDALAKCGDATTTAMRDRLLALIEQPSAPGTKARALGCLRQLGHADRVPLATKEYVAATAFPTTETWLALADEGAAAHEVLAELLVEPTFDVDRRDVAARLARTAPEVLRDWLFGDDAQLRALARHALHSIEPDSGVATESLLAMLAEVPGTADAVVEWLSERDDLGDGVERVFAWMASRNPVWTPKSWVAFAQCHVLPTARMLELLEPMLSRGHGWELLAGDDRATLRTACRTWFTKADDDDSRARLATELCRIGLATDDDTDIVLSVIRSEVPQAVVVAVADLPELPEALRARMEELLDLDDSWTAGHARRALLPKRPPR